jgi:translation initiation factor 3 subunit K
MEDQINKLLQADRYSPEIIPQLEKFVQQQVDSKTYHLEANLALLKLYQFHSDKANVQIISRILIKALMNMPSTDFLLAAYLISEKNVSINRILLYVLFAYIQNF